MIAILDNGMTFESDLFYELLLVKGCCTDDSYERADEFDIITCDES